MPRAMLVRDLAAALGWLPERLYYEAGLASVAELTRFHTPSYIAALMRAEVEQSLPADLRQATGIGVAANIIHPAVFRRPATSAGGALLAADLLAAGRDVHAPGVGNHHGMPDRASGFCFVNDIALCIGRLRDHGIRRIAYLDLDAHHGDGVETAFANDSDVLTISVHEAGRWPRTGYVHDPAHGIHNFPVPPGFNDTELAWLMTHAIAPAIAAFAPDILLLLPGADALADDSMSRLALSNNAIWNAFAAIRPLALHIAVFGGGGYNPFALARCWAGLWAFMNEIPIPDVLPPAAETVLRGVKYYRNQGRAPPAHWLCTLADEPAPGEVRDEIKRMVTS
jgi:acetoin utilization protein AcuC